MIVEMICNIFFFLANLLVNILPTFPSFEQLNLDLSPFFAVIRMVNTFIDIRVIGFCMILVLLVYNIKFVWSIFMWLVRKIPGVS